jgi:DNA-directed RNA polymerase subunit RPC12/RpoP
MTIVTLRLPEVKAATEKRAGKCPRCGCAILQRWGNVSKAVIDPRVKEALIYRYRCTGCGRTFRDYPQGITQADQTERMRFLSALIWKLGASLRQTTGIIGVWQRSVCHMTVWRDIQWAAMRREAKTKVRVAGLDGFYTKIKGKEKGLMVMLDMGDGQPVAIAEVEEANPETLLGWLLPLAKQYEVKVIVTDDLSSYPVVAHDLDLKRQVCRFHALRWMMLALKECETVLGETWQETIDEVRRILRDLPKDGPHLLHLLWMRIIPPKGPRTPEGDALAKLRLLVLRMSENWQQYALFLAEEGVPTTNNATERAIGRWRTRSKTTRGFKSLRGLTAAFLICNGMAA